MLIQNLTATNKTLTITGQAEQDTIITGGASWKDRDFEIIGGKNLTVVFQNLSIEGGHAANGGKLGGNQALGGGLLIDSGQVTLSNVAVRSNVAWQRGQANGCWARRAKMAKPTAAASIPRPAP